MSDGLFELDEMNCWCGRPLQDGVCSFHDGAKVKNTRAKVMSRHTDPSTSKRAAAAVKYRTGTHKALILHAHGRNPEGLTDEESAPASGLTYHQAERRCCDLRNEGMLTILIDADGKEVERQGTSGSWMRVSVLTDLGIATLTTMKENDDRQHSASGSPTPTRSAHIHVWTWRGPVGTVMVCKECGADNLGNDGEQR